MRMSALIVVLAASVALGQMTPKPMDKLQPLLTGKQLWEQYPPLIIRGEFEDKAAYEQRLGSIDPSRIYYIDLSAWNTFHYDIDKKVMEFRLPHPFSDSLKNVKGYELDVQSNIEESSGGTGHNAFGVQADIIKETGDKYVVSVSNIRDFMDSSNVDQYGQQKVGEFELPMNPQVAQVIKPTLKLVIGVSLNGRDDKEARWNVKAPTLRDPIDRNVTIYGMGVTLRRIMVIDTATGEIVNSREQNKQ